MGDDPMTTMGSSSGMTTNVSDGTRKTTVLFLAVFVPFFALYFATANKDLPYHIDAITNVYSAWTIGTTGTPILEAHAGLTEPGYRATYGWVVESDRGPVSQYPPGTPLLAAPLYGLFARDAVEVELVAENETDAAPIQLPVPNLVPAAIVASAVSAAGVAFLGLLLLDLGASRAHLVVGLGVVGLGTGIWSVAADALWQHGPNVFWLSLGMWLAGRNRWFGSGLAFGALALTRIPVVLVGVAIGMHLLARREFGPAARLAAGAVPGVAALLAYNWWLFGTATVWGGYGSGFAEQALDADPVAYLANIGSALFDSQHGLFVWSPIIAIVVFGLPLVWRHTPWWIWTAAAGGLAYLLFQLKANRASGGDGFTYYRYPIETIASWAPLLFLAGIALWKTGPAARLAIILTAAFSIGAHTVGAI
jgi:hypothetical protein